MTTTSQDMADTSILMGRVLVALARWVHAKGLLFSRSRKWLWGREAGENLSVNRLFNKVLIAYLHSRTQMLLRLSACVYGYVDYSSTF